MHDRMGDTHIQKEHTCLDCRVEGERKNLSDLLYSIVRWHCLDTFSCRENSDLARFFLKITVWKITDLIFYRIFFFLLVILKTLTSHPK